MAAIPPANKKITVLVEGNIGVGKTTFLDYLQTLCPDIVVMSEPLHKWRDINGHNALGKMYEDPSRWGMAFQSYVQLTMLQNHMAEHTSPIKMMERSIFSGRYCFIENLHRANLMTGMEHEILNGWFEWIITNRSCDVDLIVYLRAPASTCLERIRARDRSGEDTLSLEYLESLHNLHDGWLMRNEFGRPGAPVEVLDASQDLPHFQSDIQNRIPDILRGLVGT